jgi:hypothetical protein
METLTTYQAENGLTYAFKDPKRKFIIGGSPVELTGEIAISNKAVMERLINVKSPSIYVVDDVAASVEAPAPTAADLIAAFQETESVEALNALLPEGEKRVTVLKAYQTKLAELTPE